MRLVLLAVSTNASPSHARAILSLLHVTGPHRKMEKSKSDITSRRRDRFCCEGLGLSESESQCWRVTIHRRGAIVQLDSALIGDEICSSVCRSTEFGQASISPTS